VNALSLTISTTPFFGRSSSHDLTSPLELQSGFNSKENPIRTRSPLRTILFVGGVDISCAATGQTEKNNAAMAPILNMALPIT
jgi:hypothetical protein